MRKKYIYFYFMKTEGEKIMQVAPQHVIYWKGLKIADYLGGPFADKSGGLITFSANNLEEAEKYVNKDPFFIEDLLSDRWIKEWIVE